MTPEELDNLQKLLGGAGINPPAAPPVSAPAADPYQIQAERYTQQASDLDKQASNPYPEAHGTKEHLIEAARAAMESFGRFGAPGGYEGQEQLRRKNFNEHEDTLVSRAKDLRASAQQQQTLGETAKSREANQTIAQGNLDETKKLREIQEREAAAKEAASKKPVFTNVPDGGHLDVSDPITGLPIRTVENPKEPPNDPAMVAEYKYAVSKGYKGTIDEYRKSIRPPQQERAEPGSYQLLVNDQGQVTGAWNPKSGKVEPVPEGFSGARKAGVPPTVNSKVTDLENSFRKITDLETAYKPEFVGPNRGAYERSKATGILSHLPFLTTPEGYGEFAALNADLKNSVIKLITGAQMGQQEASRILQQVPTETDKPEMWLSKYQQTKKNAAYLLQHTKERSGLDNAPAQPAQPAADNGGFIKPGGAIENLLKGGR